MSNLIARLNVIHRETSDITYRATLKEAMRLLDPVSEKTLSLTELEDKYSTEGTWHSGWSEHPDYDRQRWKDMVADEETMLGYWEWVFNKIQGEDEPE